MTTMHATHLSERQLASLRAELEREHARLDASGRDGDLAASLADALQRMAGGRYGLCLACGGPIPFARLTALPETQYCLACGRR